MHPMTNLGSLRSGQANPLSIVRGSGINIFAEDGTEYLEGMSGLWCASLGWENEELIEAATTQMRGLAYYHSFSGRAKNPVSEALAHALIERAPERLRDGGRVFFGQSGSDANDTHVRLLWHYNLVRGKPRKRKFISRKRGYHGVTVAAGSLTGLPYLHAATGLPLDFVARHVTCPSFYRDGLPGEGEADFVRRLADELDEVIAAEGGAEEVAAFIAEPVQGAGGVIVPPEGYFEAIGDVCEKHDVMMLADEVITGVGRTGAFWGCDAVGQSPHLISCAKQLTAAYVPLSAALVPEFMYSAMEDWGAEAGGNILGHGYTYTGHPVACAVALKVIDILERDQILRHVSETTGPLFRQRLAQLASHPLVGEARGVGLLGAVELVRDKGSREQFSPSTLAAAKVQAACQERGLILRALPHDAIAVCPPLIATAEDVGEIFDRLEAALDATHKLIGD
jgi:4-aminobutyrate--pyruvate transaminase